MEFIFKKMFLFPVCIIAISLNMQAQEIVASSGGIGTSSGAIVTWTVGEPVSETSGTAPILTQGFNQGDLIITKISDLSIPGISIKVFPNPASDMLRISIAETDYENFKFSLYNQSGKPLIKNKLKGPENELNISNLVPGTYILKIYLNNKEISVYKIIKK